MASLERVPWVPRNPWIFGNHWMKPANLPKFIKCNDKGTHGFKILKRPLSYTMIKTLAASFIQMFSLCLIFMRNFSFVVLFQPCYLVIQLQVSNKRWFVAAFLKGQNRWSQQGLFTIYVKNEGRKEMLIIMII